MESLVLHRGEVEVVKCIWKTFTLTFARISTCYLVVQIQPSKTAATVEDPKTLSKRFSFSLSSRPRRTRASRGVRDTWTLHVARNGLNVSSRGHKVSAQESMKLASETNGTK